MEVLHLDPAIALLLRVCLATLFGLAAFHKVRDRHAFLETFANHEILPRALTLPGAAFVVVAELLVFLGLVGGFPGPQAGTATLALLGLYTLALAINLVRGRREIDCGCLGPDNRQPLSAWMIWRNLVLALGALALFLPVANRPFVFVDAITLLGGFLVLSLLFQAANQLAGQPRPTRQGVHST
ncbi:MAG TPA: methylamine utilization protein MauE [Deltaproteobacteria bacterium]|nr:methylamine utilization protein MauE [Deltaproteobacteria bacterium]